MLEETTILLLFYSGQPLVISEMEHLFSLWAICTSFFFFGDMSSAVLFFFLFWGLFAVVVLFCFSIVAFLILKHGLHPS